MNEKTMGWASLAAVLSFLLGLGLYYRPNIQIGEPEPVAVVEPTEQIDYPHIIPPRSTLFNVLRDLGVSSQTIHQIVVSTKDVIDLSRMRAGTQFRLLHLTDPSSEISGIEFVISPIERIHIKKVEDTWTAEKVVENVETRMVTFRGVVTSTLWESAEAAKMDPNLIVQLSEIFAWQVDFAREVRVNDRWRLSIEQKFVRGKPIGWGSILAAEFENGGQLYTAVLFDLGEDRSGYFAADGTSLKKMFLKSPIRFGRISSTFTMRRFHPVLKVRRPHLGVDYAAPIGTPVRAVGSGTVTHAAWLGGGGNTIKIRHNSTYATAYLHLSRFEKGVRAGSKVSQGQVIGFVGTTGMSTGPHLHFEFSQNGRVVNPLSQKFPSADPVPAEKMAEFRLRTTNVMGGLPGWEGLVYTATRAVGVGRILPQAHGRVLE